MLECPAAAQPVSRCLMAANPPNLTRGWARPDPWAGGRSAPNYLGDEVAPGMTWRRSLFFDYPDAEVTDGLAFSRVFMKSSRTDEGIPVIGSALRR